MRQPDRSSRTKPEAAPDLQTQLEALLDQVWLCEAEWRFDDRLKLSLSSIRSSRGDDR